MNIIGIHKKGTFGYRNLELLARELTRCSGRGYRYYVGNGYLDINTGKTYTTVMCTVSLFGTGHLRNDCPGHDGKSR